MAQLIEKKQYYLKGVSIEKRFAFIERAEVFEKETVKEDIYPGYSAIYSFKNDKDHPVHVTIGARTFKLYDGVLFYAASGCLIKWKYPPGISEWVAYVYIQDKHENISEECALFPLPPLFELNSPEQYKAVLNKSDIKYLTNRADNEISHILSKHILANFADRRDVLDVYKDLGIASSSAAYSFQRTFGVSPVYYRNKIRIFEALKLISQGDAINAIYKKVGFSSYTSFYRQFVSTLKASPADFLQL